MVREEVVVVEEEASAVAQVMGEDLELEVV